MSKIQLIKTPLSKQEISHKSVISSHGISSSDKDNDIPLLYWIPQLHNSVMLFLFLCVNIVNGICNVIFGTCYSVVGMCDIICDNNAVVMKYL